MCNEDTSKPSTFAVSITFLALLHYSVATPCIKLLLQVRSFHNRHMQTWVKIPYTLLQCALEKSVVWEVKWQTICAYCIVNYLEKKTFEKFSKSIQTFFAHISNKCLILSWHNCRTGKDFGRCILTDIYIFQV